MVNGYQGGHYASRWRNPWGQFLVPYTGDYNRPGEGDLYYDPGLSVGEASTLKNWDSYFSSGAEASLDPLDPPNNDAFHWVASYARFNDGMSGSSGFDQFVRHDEYVTPSQTGLIIDGGIHAPNHPGIHSWLNDASPSSQQYIPGAHTGHGWDGFDPCPHCDGLAQDALNGRHIGNAVTVTFADGHAETRDASVLGQQVRTGELESEDPFFVPN